MARMIYVLSGTVHVPHQWVVRKLIMRGSP